MAIPLSVNGAPFTFPQRGDVGYADQVTAWAKALTNGVLQSGGSIPFSFLVSATASPAAAGAVRLAKSDAVKWRNNANNADLSLDITSGDLLEFGGAQLSGQCAVSAVQTVAQTGITSGTNVIANIANVDTDSAYNTGTGVFTVPAGKGGRYFVSCSVGYSQVTSNGQANLQVRVNAGTQWVVTSGVITAGTSNGIVAAGIISATAGQTITFSISTSAGTLSTVTTFVNISIQRVV